MQAEPVSVVVTTRNRLPMLRRTLGSVLGQRDVEVQVLVVDEASSDGTEAFLARLDDPRVASLRNEVPVGLPAARNLGIERSGGRWVAVCDDDDLWAPGKLRAQLGALAADPAARWSTAGTVLVDERDDVIGYRELTDPDRILAQMLQRNVVPCVSGLVFERSLWSEVGRFDTRLRASEDWDFEIRMAATAPVAVANGALVAYRIAAGSMSNDSSRMRTSFDALRRRYAGLAAAEGVEIDAVSYEEYLAHQELKARRRWAATASYARLAWWRRSPRDVVRAAASAVAPAWTDREGSRRAVERVPADVRRDAEAWLSRVPVVELPSDGPARS